MRRRIFVFPKVFFAVVSTVLADLIWDSRHDEYGEGDEERVNMYREIVSSITGGCEEIVTVEYLVKGAL